MIYISLKEMSLLVFNYLEMNKYIIVFKNDRYFLTHHLLTNGNLKYNDMLRIFKPESLEAKWSIVSNITANNYKKEFQEYFNIPFKNNNPTITFSTLQEAEEFQDKLNACIILRKLCNNGLGNS